MSNRATKNEMATMTRIPLYSLNESRIESNTWKFKEKKR